MVSIEVVGFTAGMLTTVAFIPQVVKSWKTKHTKDISLGWISLVFIGVLLWLIYGILITSYPLIAANAVSFILVITILTLKLRYG